MKKINTQLKNNSKFYFHNNLNLLNVLRYYIIALFILFLSFSVFTQTTSQKVDNSPVSVLIIPDLSSSMRSNLEINKMVLESLSDFVEKSNSKNEYFIVGISSTPKIFLDANTDIAKTQKAISKVKKQKPFGASAFYDACFLGIKKLSQSQNSQKIVIILSDGADNISEKTLDELLSFLKNEKVVIYAIRNNKQENESSLRGKENLSKITSITNGEVYNIEKLEETNSIFDSIRKKL